MYKINLKRKNGFSIIINGIFIILVVICISLELYIISLNRVVQQLENNNNELLKIADELNNNSDLLSSKIEIAVEKNNKFIIFQKDLNKISEEVSFIENDYVSKKEIQDTNTYLNDLCNSIDVQDYNVQMNKTISQTEKAISDNTDTIIDLQDTKEDLDNKTNLIDENTPDDNYLSTIGLVDEIKKLFDRMYPIGSIYCTVGNDLPAFGEWTLLPNDRVLWSDDVGAGNLLDPTLPNVKGDAGSNIRAYSTSGPFSYSGSGASQISNGKSFNLYKMTMDFSRVNSIYRDGATVRPPCIKTKIYKRTG